MNDLAIEIRGLEKRFPRFKLGPLDLIVPKGAIYGLIGPNGAGKTTTIDLILGMGKKDGGEIRVLGMDHLGEEVEVKRRIGYVSPELNFGAWKTVGKLISFIRAFYPDWDDDYCRSLIDNLKVDWNEKIASLSFGSRVKVSLILALSHRPEVLLLDEPTAGLDAVSKRQIFSELLAAVQSEERTVLISSHGLADVERFSDHIGMIKEGELLVEGSTGDLLERFRMVDMAAPNGWVPDRTAGVYFQGRDEDRVRVLVDQQENAVDRIRSHGFNVLAESPVSLEDLFVALVKEEEA